MNLSIQFRELDSRFLVKFDDTSQNLGNILEEVQTITDYVGGEPYDGDYDIIPKIEQQTMLTKDKVMLDNVTVQAIPFFEVGNTSGGNTVYIANEL